MQYGLVWCKSWLGRWYDLRTFDKDVECDPQEIKALFDDMTIEPSDGIVPMEGEK